MTQVIYANAYEGINKIFDIQKETPLPEKEFQQIIKEGFVKSLCYGNIEKANDIQEKILFPKEELQKAVKQAVITSLSNRGGTNLYSAEIILEDFPLPNEIITSPEVQQVVRQEIIYYLSGGNSTACAFQKDFPLPNEIITSPEIHQAAKYGLTICLSEDRIPDASKIQNVFLPSISQLEIMAIQKEADKIKRNREKAERQKYEQERKKEHNAMIKKFEPYLKSRDKSLFDLTDVIKNKLLDELSNDATEIGYGWHKVRGLDIKDNIASYIQYFDMSGSFGVYDRDISLKIINENYIIEEELAHSKIAYYMEERDNEDERRFNKYDEYTTVDIIDINKDKKIVTVKLSGGNAQESILKVSYDVKKEK